ncbi:MAG: 50S ribosomal protein L11 methyltransferase [Candidatus Anaerobiospirillum merdipullorum]|uniref:Ribosomal protein L11 methyltransferase n=1 Tax=Candidatus Anaerobiospirillum merdipullorum TaxID=2838450 RepID=A0A9E2KP37_9GAMM|nr:50S ribosomal protein L11 methyltransferase [Candidatus Anaerobiospirillum merdipullorum]
MSTPADKQDWIEIKARCTANTADAISTMLEQLGALAVTYEDAEDSPILEPRPGERRLWPNTEVTGLFAQGTDATAIVQTLQQILGDSIPLAAVKLADKDWIRAWMDQFKPLRFGSRLWICPTWHQVPDKEAVTVMLDPGLAFGTGTHPTTALCLEWLDRQDLTNARVLDYGCGSGILAVAALKLGASEALGVDIDPQALLASKENAQRNGVDSKLTLKDGATLDLSTITPYNLAIANILAGPLAELEPYIAALTAKGAPLALSGILQEQAEEVIAAYSPDFSYQGQEVKDGWVRLSFVRC